MMFNKYDDMEESNDQNNGKGQNNFFCQSCGTSYAKWQGQCNACKEWNTIAEEIQNKIKWHGKANLSQSRTKTTKNKMKLTRQKKLNGHN
jgi:DNA repair protein RadA/Sms